MSFQPSNLTLPEAQTTQAFMGDVVLHNQGQVMFTHTYGIDAEQNHSQVVEQSNDTILSLLRELEQLSYKSHGHVVMTDEAL
jgi:hypothetical protein